MQQQHMESLELRTLFSASLLQGILLIVGTENADSIVVGLEGGSITATVNDSAQSFDTAGIDGISIEALGGNDVVTSSAALPMTVSGGLGDDTVTGGASADMLVGDGGNDVLDGGAGNDQIFGGADDDRMIWNPGDETDVNEGGDGIDTVEVNGGSGDDSFQAVANGARVHFARLDPAPFTLDIGTSEALVLNERDGNDSFVGGNGLATLMSFTIDGGTGNDSVVGTDGADTIIGGDGNDLCTPGRGSDVALLGAGDDRLVWNPGDGSDTGEGQAGTDTLQFNGAIIGENIDISANGSRARFSRDIGGVTMDLNGVETINFGALGGADNVVVNDLSGTSVGQVNIELASSSGTGDASADLVTVNGTPLNDSAVISADAAGLHVSGLRAKVNITSSEPANDRLLINGSDGNDTLTINGSAENEDFAVFPNGARLLAQEIGPGSFVLDVGTTESMVINGLAGSDAITGSNGLASLVNLTFDGGSDSDTLIGSDGADILLGGDGSDFIDGNRGNDLALMGVGDDTFEWDPGDGNDVVEGQNGTDTMLFFGSAASEGIDLSANGGRVRLFRDIASVTMDFDDVETVNINALSGADSLAVDDLSGTDVMQVNLELAAISGLGDGQADTVTINGTPGDDAIGITGTANGITITGPSATVNLLHPEAANDALTVAPLAGADNVVVHDMAGSAVAPQITVNEGNDTAPDRVIVEANDSANAITVTDTSAGTELTGLGPKVIATNANAASDALQVSAFGGSDSITVNQAGTVGAVRRVLLDGGAEQDTLDILNTASNGLASVLSSGGDDAVNVNLDGFGVANVLFDSTQRIGELDINSGGVATLSGGGGKVLTTTGLSIAGAGRLNLTDNDLIVDYTGPSPIGSIQSRLTSGRNGGAWNGNGIATSFGDASRFGLGFGEASALLPAGTFSGQPVDATAVLVKFTVYGDANLDGAVNVVDLGALATNWQQSPRSWSAGDFNYDLQVDVVDLGLLASTWQTGANAPLGPAPRPLLGSAVRTARSA